MDYDLYAQLESFSTRLTMNTMSFLMKQGELVSFEAGTVVSREGDPSDHVYIIIDGAAEVRKTDHLGNQAKIAVVSSGGVIGEMGVFLNMRRSATILALSDMKAVRFTNESFINALPKTPDLTIKLLRSLTEKVSSINWKVADLAICNAMLVLGTYILESPIEDGVGQVALDLTRVRKETRLDSARIHDALKTFLERGLVREVKSLGGDSAISFEAPVADLKKYLRKLAAKS